jgi:hypothetical protein
VQEERCEEYKETEIPLLLDCEPVKQLDELMYDLLVFEEML